MNGIFRLIYNILTWLAEKTDLSYKEINILVFYCFIPFIYIFLVDKWVTKHYFKSLFLLILVLFFIFIPNFRLFSEELFDRSVKFLESFQFIGWNYINASVIICVILPFFFFCFLFYLAYKQEIKSFF
ncbi:MAG: hypothetical protein EAZ97_01770 [Bacteroidetes bacterium]|nr:MAG: hypothetical protein EAZ97_01770 [Bacteroidota bacterium]